MVEGVYVGTYCQVVQKWKASTVSWPFLPAPFDERGE